MFVQVKLYACRFRNTYSIIVAATDAEQAQRIFGEWLEARGESASALSHRNVKRILSESRPVYTAATFDPELILT